MTGRPAISRAFNNIVEESIRPVTLDRHHIASTTQRWMKVTLQRVDMPELSAALLIGLPDCAVLGETGPGLLCNLDPSAGLPLMAFGDPERDGEAPGEAEIAPVEAI